MGDRVVLAGLSGRRVSTLKGRRAVVTGGTKGTGAGIVARLQADARLIRLPLARHGNAVTVGTAEGTWAAWVRPKGAS